MRAAVLSLSLLLAVPALAAQPQDQREKALDDKYKACIDACPKPAPRPGPASEAWARELQGEARYDNCVHNCDRKFLQGFKNRNAQGK